jgi:hypothetical protein
MAKRIAPAAASRLRIDALVLIVSAHLPSLVFIFGRLCFEMKRLKAGAVRPESRRQASPHLPESAPCSVN